MSWDEATAANKMMDVLHILAGQKAPDTGAPPPDPIKQGTGQSGHTGGGHEIGSREQDDFYTALLTKLGKPVNDANLRFMRAWNQGEGMDAGHFNPFATTQGGFGGSDLNSVGVKSYADMATGVDATAATLSNGLYAGILSGLDASDPIAAARALANSPWGTGSLALQILGGG